MPLPALIFEGIKEYYKTDESKNPFKLELNTQTATIDNHESYA